MGIIQRPNTVIMVAIIASITSHFITTGWVYVLAMSIGTVAWSAWAYDELSHGTNPFRKALGAIVLVSMVVVLYRHGY